MRSVAVVLQVIILFSNSNEYNTEAKTYYFNLNKTSNEYIIQTRINPNISAYQNDYHYPRRIQMSELRNNVTRKFIKNETYTHPLLDPEWNYNWKNITRHKLPNFIHKFYDRVAKNLSGSVRILFNANPQNSTIIKINISEDNINGNISDVELHFYHKVDKDMLQKALILRLYQVENEIFNESSLINPDTHKLLNVIYIFQAENGWQVFKLTNALHKWLQKKKNLTLFIAISKPNQEQFTFFKDGNTDIFRTFLFLKSESNDLGNLENSESDNNEHSSCRKQHLYIDFEQLNWLKFIISPPGYQAYNCYGICNKNENMSNHRKITNYVPELARKSLCCAPIKYTSLPIMFYDKNGNVVIKIYDHMIISACGCR